MEYSFAHARHKTTFGFSSFKDRLRERDRWKTRRNYLNYFNYLILTRAQHLVGIYFWLWVFLFSTNDYFTFLQLYLTWRISLCMMVQPNGVPSCAHQIPIATVAPCIRNPIALENWAQRWWLLFLLDYYWFYYGLRVFVRLLFRPFLSSFTNSVIWMQPRRDEQTE